MFHRYSKIKEPSLEELGQVKYVSEKIDGSNIGVSYARDSLIVQSREKIIYLTRFLDQVAESSTDCFNMEQWKPLREHIFTDETLTKIRRVLKEIVNKSDKIESVTIYGEFFGKGVTDGKYISNDCPYTWCPYDVCVFFKKDDEEDKNQKRHTYSRNKFINLLTRFRVTI